MPNQSRVSHWILAHRRVTAASGLALSLATAAALYLAVAGTPALATVTGPLGFRTPLFLTDGRTPELASSATGRVTAVWTRLDSNRDLAYSDLINGSWTPARRVPGSTFAEDPSIAMSPNGHTVVAWEQGGNDDKIHVSLRRAGKAWGAAQQLGVQASTSDANYQPHVDIGNNANAVVVWERSIASDTSYAVYGALARGTTFGAPQLIDGGSTAGAQHSYSPQVTIDGLGNAVMIYQHADGVSEDEVRQALAPAGSAFQAETVIDYAGIAANGVTNYLSLDSSQAGRLIGGWSGKCAGAEICTDDPYAAGLTGTTTAGFTAASKQRLSNPNSGLVPLLPTQPALIGEGYYPQAVIDEAGRGLITYEAEPDDAPDRLFSAANVDGGSFGVSAQYATGIASEFALEHQTRIVDGRTMTVLRDRPGAESTSRIYVVQGVHAASGATWGTAAAVAAAGKDADSPALTLSSSGTGIGAIIWRQTADIFVSTNVRDVTAPVVTVPANNATLPVKSGKLKFKVGCPAIERRCIGKVLLRGDGRLMGTVNFNLAGGVTQPLVIRLNSASRGMFMGPHTMPAQASIVARDLAGNSRTIKRRVKLRSR